MLPVKTIKASAPAKVNLTLHVTGQRSDGYHLLDSLVVFTDVADHFTATSAADLTLMVTGPFAQGVPVDHTNLMMRAAESVDRVLDSPKPVCQLQNFGDNSIDLELRMWIDDPDRGIANVSSSVRVAIWDLFKENNIEIPFPQRDVHFKSQIKKL